MNNCKLLIIIIILLFSYVEIFSQEKNNWINQGKYQVLNFALDTIVFLKLSSSSDTIYTYENGSLKFWDFKTGKLLFQKDTFARMHNFSHDMKTYTFINKPKFKGTTHVEIYDVFTDSLIRNVFVYDNSLITSGSDDFSPYRADYDSEKGILYVPYHYYTSWAYTTSSGNSTHTFRILQDTVLRISGLLSNPHSISDDGKRQAYYRNFTSSDSHWKTSSNSSAFGFFDRNNLKDTNVLDNSNSTSNPNPKFISVDNVKLTNLDDKISTSKGFSKIFYWDIKTKKILDTILIPVNYRIDDYKFIVNDNYIAYLDSNILILDVSTNTVIDSVFISKNAKRRMFDYNNKSKRFVFSNDDKLCIYNNELISNVEKVFFTSDSDYVYIGNPLNLYNKSSMKYDSLLWELSDGQTSRDKNPTFEFSTLGKISVKLKIYSEGKIYEGFKNDYFEVYPLLKADFEADTVYSTNAPLAVKFNDLSSGKNTSWNWEFGDSLKSNSMEANPSFKYLDIGRYSVKLTISDGKNQSTKTKNFYINIGKTKLFEFDTIATFDLIYDYMYEKINSGYPLFTDIIDDRLLAVYNNKFYDWEEIKFSIQVSDLNLNYKNRHQIIGRIFANNHRFIKTENKQYIFPSYSNILYNFDFKESSISEKKLNANLKIVSIAQNNEGKNLVACNNSNGSSLIYEINSELDIINQKNLDIIITDMDKLSFGDFLIVGKNPNSNKYKFIVLTKDLDIVSQSILELDSNLIISKIAPIYRNNNIIIGIDSISKVPHIFSYNLDGKLNWEKSFSEWESFSNIIGDSESFFITGKNKSNLLSFIEISNDGKEVNEYFRLSNKSWNSYDIDKLNDSTLFISFNDDRARIYKISYKSLIKNDNTKPDPDPNPEVQLNYRIIPNPSDYYFDVILSKPLKLKSYSIFDNSGIEVKSENLNDLEIGNFRVRTHELSTGFYMFLLKTNSEFLYEKFIIIR